MTAPATDLDDDIVLPDAPPAPSRPGLPLVASVVPVIGAVVLWAVTGSILSLWFAALGPFMAAATLLDGARAARRARRRAADAAARGRADADQAIRVRHDAQRARLERRHPDAAAWVSGAVEPWRTVRDDLLVLGRASRPSGLRVRGGAGDDAARGVRLRAATLDDAPLTVSASEGVAVAGPPALAEAVVRALVVQLCSIHPPTELRVVGRVAADHWSAALPHRRGSAVRTLRVGEGGTADLVVTAIAPDAVAPTGCAVVVRMTGAVSGELDGDDGSRRVALESLSHEQAAAAVERLAERARRLLGDDRVAAVAFADLAGIDPGPGALAAVVGVEDGHPAVVDLVADGPHAIVIGVTGAGKSELLATWVAGLCRDRDPSEVSVLLADFKGGTTFTALAALPHVVGVITDLDDASARRALESLRAEIRRREAALTAAGARDASDPAAGLGRLVVVVDEYAALLGAHPELQAVFSDVAARGRALGMHLVLGTQRATGVIRDGLLANCPLRIALRVTDAADARMLVGSPEAAALPGDPASRGLAWIRRAGDDRPRLTRIALTAPSDVARIAAAAGAAAEAAGAAGTMGAAAEARPWLPELPPRLALTDLDEWDRAPGDLVLGLADDPAGQRRRLVVLGRDERGVVAIGAAGSGKSTLADLVAGQVSARRLVRIPRDPEAAWDAVARLAESPPEPGIVVVLDDADALPTRFPADHGREVAERLERLAREAGDLGIRLVVTAQRPLGLAGRLAELLPRRLVLAAASRGDHVAAGGDPALFRPGAGPGRASMDGLAMQVAIAPPAHLDRAEPPPVWRPGRLSGLVLREGAAQLAAACRDQGVAVRPVDEVAADERAPVGPLVVLGDPEAWQRHWRLLALVRAEGELVVDAGCAAELRLLIGQRGLPPYCRPGAGRAWRVDTDGRLQRMTLPGRQPEPPRPWA